MKFTFVSVLFSQLLEVSAGNVNKNKKIIKCFVRKYLEYDLS